MQYEIGTYKDWPAIAEYVNSVNYFLPVDPSQLGGTWIIAQDAQGRVHGTIWFFHQGPHAYLDYWAATSSSVAAKLCATAIVALRAVGVKYVRAVIAKNNDAAYRLASKGFGMISGNDPYNLVFRSI